MNKSTPKISFTGARRAPRAKLLNVGRITGKGVSFGKAPAQNATPKTAPKKIAVRNVYEQPEILHDAEEEVPDVPLHAMAGLMAAPHGPMGGMRRAYFPVLAGVCALTFFLGMAAVMMWDDGADQAAIPPTTEQAQDDTAPEPQFEDTVTRTSAPDLTDVTGGGQPVILSDDLAAAVLAGLQPKRSVTNVSKLLNENQMRMLHEGVLVGAYTIETQVSTGIERVRLSMLNVTTTSDTFRDLVTQAAAEGAEAALEMSRRIFAASTVKSRLIGGERIYIVEPGDSLAYIALQFYGKPGAYQRILEANRNTLQSPERIRIGQRLIIPS